MKTLLYIALLFVCSVAQAAKVQVNWINPTKQTDGSDLTDLVYIIIEWGSCKGVVFDVTQNSITVTTTETGKPMSVFIYPVNLTRVCVRAQAFSSTNASDYSNTAFKDLLPTTGKPVTLGQPVIIP